MNLIAQPALVMLLLLVSLAGLASEQKQRAADQEAGKWLALVDGRQYQASWEQAAALFRQQVSAAQWRQAVTSVRRPLGSMISRKLIAATYTNSLPGAPDGEYVVLQYQTEFENKQQAIETVTPMLDDGRWRVSGYYLR
ncbi:MAG: DUF4019 domain-containing protein [Gammaproteobacteria bacterium]|nr:DUF4019 domain-containing protein [Gammaproteobacteria bacterium]MDH3447901.1 DUF4019 domain-containing protein [Gammaproteobacteria bacterium]